jgi:hypothetical protein
MQLEGPKRKRLNHSIIDYIQLIIMTNDEYLQALDEKVIKKKNQGMQTKKTRVTRQQRKKSTRKGNSKSNKV